MKGELSGERCAMCGHSASDHREGWMGGEADDQPLCHVDDHSCYHRWTVYGARPTVSVPPVRRPYDPGVETEQ
jgi:hypothetical protein